MQQNYHIPVLLKESIIGLNIDPKGIYVDVTFGGGGHSKEILKKLTTGKLIAFDQDADTQKKVDEISKDKKLSKKFIFFQANFKYLSNYIKYAGFDKVDGILADLGVSSHQFDNKGRGFSFRLGGIPDMRMNKKANLSSLEILNKYSQDELIYIFKNYGELRSASRLSNAICIARNEKKIEKIEQLNDIIEKTLKTKKEFKILALVYQALRIETNNELDALKTLMIQSSDLLKPSGRLVVISYHSLEDRLVKNYLKYNNFKGEVNIDLFGKQYKEFNEISKKVIVPNDEEININNRARSAKLRIAERI